MERSALASSAELVSLPALRFNLVESRIVRPALPEYAAVADELANELATLIARKLHEGNLEGSARTQRGSRRGISAVCWGFALIGRYGPLSPVERRQAGSA